MNLTGQKYRINIGGLNFETPFNLFMKNICHETLDSLIMHKNLTVEGIKTKCSIILFKKKLVKSEVIKSKNFYKDKSKLESVLILEMKQINDIDYEIKENIFLLKILYITANNSSSKPLNYVQLNIKFDEINEGKIFKYFLEKYRNIYFQGFFEENIPILPPYIYQYHFFLTKVNSRGDEDNRLIVITDKYLLNIEYQVNIKKKSELNQQDFEFKLSKAKWALSIDAFEELQLIGNDIKSKIKGTEDRMIRIKINNSKNKEFVNKNKNLTYKKKTSVDFIFRNEKIARYFIFQIKRLYFDITRNNNLKIIENA